MYFCLFNLVFNFDGGNSAAGSNQWNYPSVNDGRVHPFRSPNPIHQSPNPPIPIPRFSTGVLMLALARIKFPVPVPNPPLIFFYTAHTHTWGKSIKKKSFVS